MVTKSRKIEKKEIFILVAALLISFVIVSMLLYIYFNHLESTPYWVPPKISYEIIAENDNYTIRITEAKEGDSPLDLEQLGVGVVNGTQSILKVEDLTKLFYNTTSNLSFYDEDNDGKLSKGDFFVIRGNIAIEGRILRIWSTYTGELLKNIPFK
ncbi:MAG: hypothetical protein A7315_06710 [Candidatus Altiarchaeales archaeon WOR_SM1_79]|nr:MAG: hypothetical protein A7315_06710 [Candidatus Altiarchaeales archaeon WOR_SM1_79]